jgi:16S rRNA (adenine1518-N6/adenine1519-N6)-dimethyltransferase
VLEQIISAARIKKDELVLEIGPGTGALTAALLRAGANVVAVEKDDRAHEILKERFSTECASGQLNVIYGDILDKDIFMIRSLPLSKTSNGSYAIVANIPYYITGAILERFLEHEPRPNRMVLLVQKEVAERIVARPPNGNKSSDDGENRGKESILSISVKAFGTPKIIANVPRGAFTPPPTVDSAILAIDCISDRRFRISGRLGKEKSGSDEDNIDIKRFFEIVRAGFAHKRKYLKRNLESVMPAERLSAIWIRLGLDDKARAEDMNTEQWSRIAVESL